MDFLIKMLYDIDINVWILKQDLGVGKLIIGLTVTGEEFVLYDV